MKEEIIQFLRKRDYKFVKELGQGACGKTILLHDDILNRHFVCKKYSPFYKEDKTVLFDGFIREIQLLHELHHKNIVRLFNYYLYPDSFSGYILLEYIEGADIDEYIKSAPEQINEIFLQVIDGFCYLEKSSILHRDIRPQNLLVCQDGTVKIIDLGFGKQVKHPVDFDKSISLNWWCEPPVEFSQSKYDFRTEVYFVGKLFEQLIQQYGINQFKYKNLLVGMCNKSPEMRVASFSEIQKSIKNDLFLEIDFDEKELLCYRGFADAMTESITKIENGAKYVGDVEQIKTHLEPAYRNCMLEENAPDSAPILKCFIIGSYHYYKGKFPVRCIKSFLHLLKVVDHEKQRILLANLHTRFDAIPRYSWQPPDMSDFDNDIPF